MTSFYNTLCTADDVILSYYTSLILGYLLRLYSTGNK